MKSSLDQKVEGRSQRLRRAAGFSLVELLIVIAVMLIIASIAIPRLLRAKMSANEVAAASALRSVCTVQVNYESTYSQGFAPSLSALGPPPAGSGPSATKADLIDSVLASGIRNGYNFVYVAIDNGGTGKPDSFTINANPISPGQTGEKYFYVDQTNVIRYTFSGPAGPSSPPIPQ